MSNETIQWLLLAVVTFLYFWGSNHLAATKLPEVAEGEPLSPSTSFVYTIAVFFVFGVIMLVMFFILFQFPIRY